MNFKNIEQSVPNIGQECVISEAEGDGYLYPATYTGKADCSDADGEYTIYCFERDDGLDDFERERFAWIDRNELEQHFKDIEL